jgi:outer membrane biosynthesis protein TonB
MRFRALAAGLVLTLLVHAAIVAFMIIARPAPRMERQKPITSSPVGFGLCGKRRCGAIEARRRRQRPEPAPVDPLEVLEASLVPALGMVEPDPSQLPKLQTYEQKQIVKDGVNLDKNNKKPLEDLKKAFDPEEAKRDPKNKNKKLDDLLKDFEEDDPRKRATDLSRIVGRSDGDVDGSGFEKREGARYARLVTKALKKVFKPPVHISEDALKGLRFVVKVMHLSPDGEILRYKVLKRSGNSSYDNAAESAIQQFAPKKGGTKTFPPPPTDVLRYVNSKGMKLDLDGKYYLGRGF